jgi:hypothetical protein
MPRLHAIWRSAPPARKPAAEAGAKAGHNRADGLARRRHALRGWSPIRHFNQYGPRRLAVEGQGAGEYSNGPNDRSAGRRHAFVNIDQFPLVSDVEADAKSGGVFQVRDLR